MERNARSSLCLLPLEEIPVLNTLKLCWELTMFERCRYFQTIAARKDNELRVLYCDFVRNVRVTGGRVRAFADKRSFYFLFVVFYHRGYDLGKIKTAVNTIFSEAIHYEKSIAAGSEMNGPDYRPCPLLVIGHIHVDVCNLRIVCRYKACVGFQLH